MDNAGAMSAITTEKLVDMWNNNIEFSLSVSDLTPTVKPALLMGALMEILHKLDVDRDAIVAPPPDAERDEHTEYYWDLIPVINMTRVLNHILSPTQCGLTTTMMDLLNPSANFARSILLVLLNLVLFITGVSEGIEPREKELFESRDRVAALEEQRNQLLALLNEQAASKAARSMRLQKLEEDKKTHTEELKREKQQHEDELRELEHVLGENSGLRASLDKKKLQKEALATELARVKAQRVNDAEDISAQLEQAERGEQEVTRQLDALKETLLQKEATVRNLQAVRGRLDEGVLSVQEITALTGTLRETNMLSDREQAEAECAVGERRAALQEAEARLAALQLERRELRERRERDAEAARLAIAQQQSAARDAEARRRAAAERAERAEEHERAVREVLEQYEREKETLEMVLERLPEILHSKVRMYEEFVMEYIRDAGGRFERMYGRR